MSSLFQNILGLLLVYKYTALFLIAFLSSLGVPLPAGSSTVASAAFASQGYLDIFTVLTTGALGNILGDISMYALSKKYGKKVLRWFRLGKLIESKPLKYMEKVENNYSATTIIISRFQDQATAIINAVAGLGGMKFKHFVLYAIIGDIIQIAFYSGIGYFFAENWQVLYNAIGVFSWLILLVTIIVSILVANKFTKKMFD
jgi:membrane protein DedA with SNARE-associated domain